MNLIEQKKYVNISEYIIYMYQTEDLIRSFDFNLEMIEKDVVDHIPDDSSKGQMKDWYGEVIEKMKSEEIEKNGHLEELDKLVSDLSNLSKELLQEDEEYLAIFQQAKPHLDRNMEYASGLISNDIQLCLNGIYGLLLSRINGKQISQDDLQSISTFGDVLSYLSFKFKQKGYLSPNWLLVGDLIDWTRSLEG